MDIFFRVLTVGFPYRDNKVQVFAAAVKNYLQLFLKGVKRVLVLTGYPQPDRLGGLRYRVLNGRLTTTTFILDSA